MTDNPKPKKTDRYYITTSLGYPISEKRPRESAAWAHAAHKLGYTLKRDVDAAIRDLKQRGCICKKVDGLSVHVESVPRGEILHMRLNSLESERIAALVDHFSTENTPATRSWVIRHLISEKIKQISENKETSSLKQL